VRQRRRTKKAGRSLTRCPQHARAEATLPERPALTARVRRSRFSSTDRIRANESRGHILLTKDCCIESHSFTRVSRSSCPQFEPFPRNRDRSLRVRQAGQFQKPPILVIRRNAQMRGA
jgi:hypothetical protein